MEVLRATLLHRRDGSIHQPSGLALQDKEEGGGQCKEGAVEKVRTFRWELWHFLIFLLSRRFLIFNFLKVVFREDRLDSVLRDRGRGYRLDRGGVPGGGYQD